MKLNTFVGAIFVGIIFMFGFILCLLLMLMNILPPAISPSLHALDIKDITDLDKIQSEMVKKVGDFIQLVNDAKKFEDFMKDARPVGNKHYSGNMKMIELKAVMPDDITNARAELDNYFQQINPKINAMRETIIERAIIPRELIEIVTRNNYKSMGHYLALTDLINNIGVEGVISNSTPFPNL